MLRLIKVITWTDEWDSINDLFRAYCQMDFVKLKSIDWSSTWLTVQLFFTFPSTLSVISRLSIIPIIRTYYLLIILTYVLYYFLHTIILLIASLRSRPPLVFPNTDKSCPDITVKLTTSNWRCWPNTEFISVAILALFVLVKESSRWQCYNVPVLMVLW